ncbi:MAG TPA: glycerol-3-phosphate 1-O-acyltransferase PlsY [Anaeromyxobacteraceae bacterium]|nr:glycerol-3-phosphate 1-O-acyltransferase PlsY [Anaeromyxobacteraceae bacterium]
MNPGLKVSLVIGAYLLGSVPFGVLVTRLFAGKDVRQVGSGNIGASNVARAAGKGAGALTLLLDAAKGSLPMLLALHLFPKEDAVAAQGFAALVGLAAFLGHIYPIWLRFRGGKGVATALGVFLVLAPLPALLALAAFCVVFGATRVAALGSLSATAVGCIGLFAQALSAGGVWKSPAPWAGLFIALAIVARHRSNIERLMKGVENKV